MIGSPRYNAIQTATEDAVGRQQRGNTVADAAIHELDEYRADTAENKLRELYQTCVRCRKEECSAIWDEMRVCDTCLRILTDKYDRKPEDPRGRYTDGFMDGKRAAYHEAADWVRDALRSDERIKESPF